MTKSFFASRHFVSSFLTTAANAIQQLIFISTLLIQPLNTVSLHALEGTEGPSSSGFDALSPNAAPGINS
ncbi:hypothetical protein [Methylomonas albis]|nr:hypothetical protein [Methylomonas albis]